MTDLKDETAEEAARTLAERWWKAGVVSHLFTTEREAELAAFIREAEERGAAREREECAKVADAAIGHKGGSLVWWDRAAASIANTIRSRSEAKPALPVGEGEGKYD